MAVRDMTLAAVDALRHADKAFYLVADPVSERYLKGLKDDAKSLFGHYGPGKDRRISYQEMIDEVVESLDISLQICVAFYGHPGIFVFPSHEMIKIARLRGHTAQMLPGISAEDWLFADLVVDPAQSGCLSYEATDFLIHERPFDARSQLVLWQIGVIGNLTWSSGYDYQTGARVLTNKLLQQYPADHPVTIYEASQYVVAAPRIDIVRLAELPEAILTPISTLYVPPAEPSAAKASIMRELNMALNGTCVSAGENA